MKKSDTITKLAAALVKTQAALKPALKDSDNPFFKSTYADLESCWDAARQPLASNGLCILQLPCQLEGKPALETMLIHESGEWISETAQLYPVKLDPQALGSAITYARRYGLAAIIGLVQTDDDGNAATGKIVPSSFKTQDVLLSKQEFKRDPLKPATEKQLGFIKIRVQQDLCLDDEQTKLFVLKTTGKKLIKDLVAGDVDVILNAIQERLKNMNEHGDAYEPTWQDEQYGPTN